jgi:glutaredoxin 3
MAYFFVIELMERRKDMKLYSKKVCPKCMLMKFELKKLGFERQYEEINVDSNEEAKERLLKAGFFTVPVMEIDGELMDDMEEAKKIIGMMKV